MYQFILLHSCDYLKKISIETNMVTDKHNNSWNEIWHWTNNEIGVTVQSWLSVSWTHGLIAQSVRASERNSVVVGSNPTQVNFLWLLQRILQWWIPYASVHSATLMWLLQEKFRLKQMRRMTKTIAKMKSATEQMMKLE